jgi:hypothetical protein
LEKLNEVPAQIMMVAAHSLQLHLNGNGIGIIN